MSKIFFSLLPFFLFFGACTGGPRPVNYPDIDTDTSEPLLLSLPAESGLVFIGVAGKRSHPRDTVQSALEEAARRVAVFHNVSGEYLAENNIGSGAFDYTHNTRTVLYYDREGSGRYVDLLSYNSDTDAVEIDNTLIIRTTYRAALPHPVQYHPVYKGAEKKPDWVDNPPSTIGEYEAGIGYAGRHSTIAEACVTSFSNAIFAIIRNVCIKSSNTDILYQGSGLFDYKTSNNNIIYASGSLSNFYVLDTWIDPANKSVWTLAIAQKSE